MAPTLAEHAQTVGRRSRRSVRAGARYFAWVICVPLALAALVPALAHAEARTWEERVAAGVQAYREGRLDHAERYFAEAVAAAERANPREWRLVMSLVKLADTVRMQGREADAAALYQRALTAADEVGAGDHLALLDPVKALAALHARALRYGEAERLYGRALTLFERSRDREAAAYLHLRSDLSRAEARYPDAETLLRRALALIERAGGTDDGSLGARAAALSDLAMLLRIQGKAAESEALAERVAELFGRESERLEPIFREAVAMRTQVLGPRHPGVANTLYYLARLFETRQRYEEAESFHQRALEILGAAGDGVDLTLAAGLEAYAALLRKMGRESQARLREGRAAAIRAAVGRQEAAALGVGDRN